MCNSVWPRTKILVSSLIFEISFLLYSSRISIHFFEYRNVPTTSFCFIKSLTYINASFAAPFVNLTLILAAVWGYFLYDEIPTQNTFIGSLLIVVAGVILTRLKNK